MGSHGRSQEGSAIAQDRDEPGQMLQLQPIVERVPKAMGPMEEGQGDEDEEVESYQRMRDEPLEELVAGCLEPSQGKGQTGQKEMDGEEAATVPPALNKSHKSGVIRPTIYPRSSIKATAPESTSQAA